MASRHKKIPGQPKPTGWILGVTKKEAKAIWQRETTAVDGRLLTLPKGREKLGQKPERLGYKQTILPRMEVDNLGTRALGRHSFRCELL